MNDFIDRGRVKKVYIQGESDARAVPSDLGKWFVRSSNDSMTPFSAFATTHWQYGPESFGALQRLRRLRNRGENASGFSSGVAMEKMEALANSLPAGTTGRGAACRFRKSWPAGRP